MEAEDGQQVPQVFFRVRHNGRMIRRPAPFRRAKAFAHAASIPRLRRQRWSTVCRCQAANFTPSPCGAVRMECKKSQGCATLLAHCAAQRPAAFACSRPRQERNSRRVMPDCRYAIGEAWRTASPQLLRFGTPPVPEPQPGPHRRLTDPSLRADRSDTVWCMSRLRIVEKVCQFFGISHQLLSFFWTPPGCATACAPLEIPGNPPESRRFAAPRRTYESASLVRILKLMQRRRSVFCRQ